MTKLRVSMACGPFDRFQPLLNGAVQVEGAELNFIPLEVEETFWRQFRHREFDVAELSFSSYVLHKSQGHDDFVALPVFTSRSFRHSGVYVNAAKGIKSPADLRGRLVGVPEYQMTAALWLRGIFQEYYGVAPGELRWRTGGLYQPDRREKIPLDLPAGVECRPIPAGRTLSDLLEAGEIDAVFSARMPRTFMAGSPNVRRLFADYAAEEARYYRATGIFPIMHVLTIRREIYAANRWLAVALYKACLAAKRLAERNLGEAAALYTMLPWQINELERTRALMGEDWWPYGLEANRKTVAALCRYSFEQGLAARLLSPEELFAPETLETFKI